MSVLSQVVMWSRGAAGADVDRTGSVVRGNAQLRPGIYWKSYLALMSVGVNNHLRFGFFLLPYYTGRARRGKMQKSEIQPYKQYRRNFVTIR